MKPVVVVAADRLADWDARRLGQTQKGTVSFSLRMRGAGRTGIAIEATCGDDPRWQLWVTATGLDVRARWAHGWRTHSVTAPNLDDGAWHDVVVCSAHGRFRVWLDGDLVYQAPGEAWFADGAALPGEIDTVVVGRAYAGERLMGEIANTHFYDHAVTHEQALALMHSQPPHVVTVLRNHDGMCYRIPALTSVGDTLVLVADRRHNGPGDAPNVIDLVCCRSLDGGQTWSDPQVIAPPFEGGASTDACVFFDHDTGKLWATYSAYAPGHSQPAVLRGDPSATAHIQYVVSEDAGATWSAPLPLVPLNLSDTVRCLGVSPGAGCVLGDGTLVIPAYHEVTDVAGQVDFAATVLTSTDHGGSWQVGNPVWADGHASYESTVFEGDDGVLVLMARNQHPSGTVMRATSHDLGLSWQDVEFLADVPEIFSQPSSTRLHDGRIAFCNPSAMLPHRGWGRIRVSTDLGKSWPVTRTINADRHGYQSMAELPDGTLVVAWEHEWDAIDVTRCPPGWI